MRSFEKYYAEPSRNGVAPPKALRGKGYPMIGMGHLYAGRRIVVGDAERVPLDAGMIERASVIEGDLLFARRSLKWSGAGVCGIVGRLVEPTVFESSIIRVRLDDKLADPEFFAYYFRVGSGRQAIESIIEQTAVAGIRASDLAKLKIEVPPLPEQQAVVSILSALDDKIESNRRAAEGLIRIVARLGAQALHQGDSRLPLDALVQQIREPGDRMLPYFGLDDMPRGSTVLGRWKTENAPTGSTWAFRPMDILFGKLRPYFKKVGIAPIEGRCTREILVLRPVESRYFGLLATVVPSQAFVDYCVARSTGTRMPRAEWGAVSSYEVSVPAADVLDRLDGVAKAAYSQVACLVGEGRILAAIRDTLLPKLVSGQIRVPLSADPEEQVAAAVQTLGRASLRTGSPTARST